mmetsp:Transcript_16309/g.35277  ORF Transcript_16309/g.35277 Transcript_16309/m.35277 type:complete len:213 (-) Transcript_16309:415-1053(-)
MPSASGVSSTLHVSSSQIILKPVGSSSEGSHPAAAAALRNARLSLSRGSVFLMRMTFVPFFDWHLTSILSGSAAGAGGAGMEPPCKGRLSGGCRGTAVSTSVLVLGPAWAACSGCSLEGRRLGKRAGRGSAPASHRSSSIVRSTREDSSRRFESCWASSTSFRVLSSRYAAEGPVLARLFPAVVFAADVPTKTTSSSSSSTGFFCLSFKAGF